MVSYFSNCKRCERPARFVQTRLQDTALNRPCEHCSGFNWHDLNRLKLLPGQQMIQRFSLLVALVAAHRTSVLAGLQHACEREAALLRRGFVSTCGHTVWVEGDDVTIYACVPKTSKGPISVSYDPVSRAYAADSLVGRVHPDGALPGAWDNVFPIDFDSRPPQVLHGPQVFMCCPGIISGLSAGAYNFSVLHEYSDWLWDPPWNTTNASAPRFPFGFALHESWAEQNSQELVAQTPFKVTPKLSSRPRPLPACTVNLNGRWQDGRYIPATCVRRRPSYDEFDTCMAKLNGEVRLYGDSHTRRAMKALFTKGDWCSSRRASRICMCEDNGEPDMPYEHKKYLNSSWVSMHWMAGSLSPRVFDDIARARVKVLVVGGLSAWSVAGENLSTYIATLERTVTAVQHANATALIFRNAPAFCCTVDSSRQRRYTSKRDGLFNRLFKQRMTEAFPEALWWDTRAMTEARPLAVIRSNAQNCTSNHMDSVLVEEDLATFMHFICSM